MNQAFIDFTKVRNYRQNSAISTVRRALVHFKIEIANLTIVLTPSQQFVAPTFDGANVLYSSDAASYEPLEVVSQFHQWIAQARASMSQSLVIISYHGKVLSAANKYQLNEQLTVGSFSNIFDPVQLTIGQAPSFVRNNHPKHPLNPDGVWTPFLSIWPDWRKVANDLANAMRKKRKYRYGQPEIRHLLIGENRSIYQKRVDEPNNFVKVLLDILENQGFVTIDRTHPDPTHCVYVHPKTEWLEGEIGVLPKIGVSDFLSEQKSGSLSPNYIHNPKARVVPQTASNTSHFSATAPTSNRLAANAPNETTPNETSPAASNPTVGSPTRKASTKPRRSLASETSRRFEDIIRRSGFGPYAPIRSQFFELLDSEFPKSIGKSVTQIVRDCIDKFESENPNLEFNWRLVGDAFIRLLLHSEALLDTGENPVAIQNTVAGRRTSLGAVVENWTLRVESQLLLLIVSEQSFLLDTQFNDVGGALFNTRKASKYEDRVLNMIELLLSENLIVEDSSGTVTLYKVAATSTERDLDEQPCNNEAKPVALENETGTEKQAEKKGAQLNS